MTIPMDVMGTFSALTGVAMITAAWSLGVRVGKWWGKKTARRR